jgi:hypothetical protein
MGKFLRNLIFILILILIALVVGMISPGKQLSSWKKSANKIYNEQVRFRNTPIAEGFTSNPFALGIEYLENTEGKLEVYFVNSQKNEILPVFEIEGTTQVGDVSHRFRGIGEEGRNKLKNILENAREGGASALDKALELLGK